MMIPIGVTPIMWASSLFVDFPTDDIPILLDDNNNWKQWGNQLVQEDTFADNNAPNTEGFTDWESWAQAVYTVMVDNS